MKKFFINIRYFIVPVLCSVTILGLIVGGPFVWTGAVLFLVGITIDTLVIKFHTKGAGVDENGKSYGIKELQNLVMYFMLPVFIILQVALAWRIYQYTNGADFGLVTLFGWLPVQTGITGLELYGATLSAGAFAGLGIIYGHELSHTKDIGWPISRLMMGLSGAAHFCYAHVYNHHLELAHENDPATSPRGRSLYKHFWLSHMGQSKFSYDLEREKLEKQGKSFFSLDNKWITGYIISLPTIILFVWAGGIVGVACMFFLWTVSNFELEALNYMEHFGLVREKDKPIEHRHSWDNDTAFTSWFFIEIGRQCDHHVRGETHFWELEDVGGPNPGWGYFTGFTLALVPPLWHALIKKKLDHWDNTFANDAEREIATKINKQASYA
jgi:alkane 1-monooxygenase